MLPTRRLRQHRSISKTCTKGTVISCEQSTKPWAGSTGKHSECARAASAPSQLVGWRRCPGHTSAAIARSSGRVERLPSPGSAVLTVHLSRIVWVIFGWIVARNRPILRWLHILSLIYSVLIETLPWPCPLTLAETRLEGLAGIQPYREPFLVHYLEMLIYTNIPPRLLGVVRVRRLRGHSGCLRIEIPTVANRWLVGCRGGW